MVNIGISVDHVNKWSTNKCAYLLCFSQSLEHLKVRVVVSFIFSNIRSTFNNAAPASHSHRWAATISFSLFSLKLSCLRWLWCPDMKGKKNPKKPQKPKPLINKMLYLFCALIRLKYFYEEKMVAFIYCFMLVLLFFPALGKKTCSKVKEYFPGWG